MRTEGKVPGERAGRQEVLALLGTFERNATWAARGREKAFGGGDEALDRDGGGTLEPEARSPYGRGLQRLALQAESGCWRRSRRLTRETLRGKGLDPGDRK